MDFRIEFGADPPADVTVTTSGSADAATFAMMNGALVGDERFVPGMSVLVDHSSLDTSELSLDDIQDIARTFEGLGDRIGRTDIAIVAPTLLAWGQTRQSITLAQETLARVRVFRTEDDALRWIAGERGD
jgi:hypothetical protein